MPDAAFKTVEGFPRLLSERLPSQQFTAASRLSVTQGVGLAEAVSQLGLLPDIDIAGLIVQASGSPVIADLELQPDLSSADRLNPAWLSSRHVLPISRPDKNLGLAMADPGDDHARKAMEFAAGVPNSLVNVATFGAIAEALSRWRATTSDSDTDLVELETPLADGDLNRLADATSDAPVIRLVRRLLTDAVAQNASDVHFEPMAHHTIVRYRIDGTLNEIERLPESMALPIASRIKIMAGLDIAESRLPQDGRLRLTVRGRNIDVRVATSPIAHGESIVLRLLGRNGVQLDLNALGIAPDVLRRLSTLLERPNGMILVTGPTGSGKTTTLYAALERLRRPEIKILTVEDPVEIMLEGVNQVQVRPEIDLDYAATLRAFLRQDPDVLMVGEIRDRDTADIAMRAALTGHLVLSTLHTNSALGAFTRLRDIGIEPFLTASTVIATMAQRLVRRLCVQCTTLRAPSESEVTLFKRHGFTAPTTLHDPLGCEACGGTGWRGRHLVMELVEVDDQLRAAIRDDRVEELERRPSPDSLAGHGLALVAAGTTSLDEVRRVIAMP